MWAGTHVYSRCLLQAAATIPGSLAVTQLETYEHNGLSRLNTRAVAPLVTAAKLYPSKPISLASDELPVENFNPEVAGPQLACHNGSD